MYKLPNNTSDYLYTQIREIFNKRVIIRSCLNVPIDKESVILNKKRLQEALPLIQEMAEIARSVVVIGHLGRPMHKDPRYSLKPVVDFFEKYFRETEIYTELIPTLDQQNIKKIQDNADLPEKKIFFLENIRFFEEEESSNPEKKNSFADTLALLGDVFINDAFADYRQSVSTYELAKRLPSYIGPRYMAEISSLSKIGFSEDAPSIVMGGAKLSEKLDTLYSLLEIADKVLVGGAMAYTLLKAKGIPIGKSIYEEDKIRVSKDILNKYNSKIILPIDHVIVSELSQNSVTQTTENSEIPKDTFAIDIGPKTINLFTSKIKNSKKIFWNGPMGIFEWETSHFGTKAIAESIASNKVAYKVAGGGETISAIEKFGLETSFNFISTGGGASLSFLANSEFPTLDVIIKK